MQMLAAILTALSVMISSNAFAINCEHPEDLASLEDIAACSAKAYSPGVKAATASPSKKDGLAELVVQPLETEFFEEHGFDGTTLGYAFRLSLCQTLVGAVVSTVPQHWANEVSPGDYITLSEPLLFRDPDALLPCFERIDLALRRGAAKNINSAEIIVVPAQALSQITAYVKENGRLNVNKKFPIYYTSLLHFRHEFRISIR